MERTMADDAREIVEILDKGSPEAEEIIMWWRERRDPHKHIAQLEAENKELRKALRRGYNYIFPEWIREFVELD